MSASSPIAICNRALTLVGSDTITSFTDGTVPSKMCAIHYEQVRDAVTNAHEWSFAVTRFGPLVRSPDAPAYEFNHQFLLPTDTLRVIWAGTDPEGRHELRKYSVEGRFLLANEETGINIRYLKRVTDTTQFAQLYTEALVGRLAAELAIPLAESRTLQQSMFQLYQAKVDEGAAVDGLQGRNERTDAVRHQRARWQYGGLASDLYRVG